MRLSSRKHHVPLPGTIRDAAPLLGRYTPARLPLTRRIPRAGIAVVLAERHGAPHVLCVRRAKQRGDPWSGDMACPGGRAGTGEGARAAAVRESFEEAGLDLAIATSPGKLSDVPTRTHERLALMAVEPHVFTIDSRPELSLNRELTKAVWVPLAVLANPENRGAMTWRFAGVDWRTPCCDYGEYRLWGLTLIVLDELVYALSGGLTGKGFWARRVAKRLAGGL
ncbi:MAG: NUDIX hydrolase [Desulfatibacillaceae bacterium]